MRRVFTLLGAVGGIVLFVGGAWLWLGSRPSAEPELLQPHLVSTAAVEERLVAAGLIRPATTLDVRAEASGLVEAVLVKEGDAVKRGQVLARLSSALAESLVDEAEANLRQTQLQDEATATELDGTAVELRRRAHARSQDLHARGLLSRQALETSELELRQAEKALGLGQRNRQRSYAQVEEARAGVARARAQLDRTVIRAPFDGVVLRQFITVGSGVSGVGQSAAGGSVLMSIGDRRRSAFYARVTAADAARLQPGMAARIQLDGGGQAALEGVVLTISTSGDFDGPSRLSTFPIVVALSETPTHWVNVPARAEIVLGVQADAVVVPLGCGWTDAMGQSYARIETPEGPARRDIELGAVEPARLHVVRGLTRGETILCR